MKRYRVLLSMTIVACGCAVLSSARAEDLLPPVKTAHVAVVELFTSEGCSSCPPAEAVLKDFVGQPDVVALAFHVDYWNDLGWKDRFSMPLATLRQRQYVETLGLSSGFTPQVVVDGRASLLGSDRRRIAAAVGGSTGVEVGLGLEGGKLIVTLPATPGESVCDVNLVAYLSHASTAVGRGENAGRTLEEFNIVRVLRRLGTWQRGRAATFEVPLGSVPADADRVAVLVQRDHQGPVEGAATLAVR